MKVLIVTSWYPNKDNRLSGVFIKEQALALKESGIKVEVLFPFDKSIIKGKLEVSIEDGIKTYRCNTDYLKNTIISRINSIILSVRYLRKITYKENFDIIHSHVCYPAGFISYFYWLIFKVPYVITEHMSYISSYSKKWYNDILFKLAYKNAAAVISVSKSLSDELKKLHYSFNEVIVGNVVDTSQQRTLPVNEVNKTFNMIFIGSMDNNEGKGVQYLLPATKKFIDKNPNTNVTLTLVGDGVKRESYELMAKKLGIDNVCTFSGKVPKNQVGDLINKSDFMIHPSLKETFGCVLIESMAYGKPVLATRCGGPEDFVNEDVGILVEKQDIEELEKGIEVMIEKYHNFSGEYIRKYAIDNYSYTAIGNKIRNIYLNIIKSDGEL